MDIDDTILDIFTEIQKRFKDKYKKDISVEQLTDIVNVQINATLFGFTRNIPIYWKGFLRFIYTDRRQRIKEKRELFATVSDVNNNLSDEDREYYRYLARVVSHSNYKELESLNIKAKALTPLEVENLPTTTRIRNFQSLTRRK